MFTTKLIQGTSGDVSPNSFDDKVNRALTQAVDGRVFHDIKFSSANNNGLINYSALIIFKLPERR